MVRATIVHGLRVAAAIAAIWLIGHADSVADFQVLVAAFLLSAALPWQNKGWTA